MVIFAQIIKADEVLADDKCMLQIFSTSAADVTEWYRLWEAVTAVFSICVRAGEGGIFRRLGESSFSPMIEKGH